MAMNERVHIMRESIVKLTQLLAGKGVRVTQCGTTAFVQPDHTGKPVLVNLPYMPDNATDELLDAIQGFLDHEVAHILFTDFKLANTIDRNAGGQFWNVLEDTRIERCMAQRYQGSAENLARTGKFFLDKYTTPNLAKATAKGDEEAAQAILAVPLIRAMAGQLHFKEFMKSHMTRVDGIYSKIKDLAPRIETLSSTQESYDLSKEIVARLRDGKVPPTTKPEEEPAPSAALTMPGSPGAGSAGKGKGEGKGKVKGKGKSAAAEKEEGEGGGSGKPEEKKEKAATAPKTTPEEEKEKSGGEGEGEGEETEPTPAADPSADPATEGDDDDEGDDDEGDDDDDELDDGMATAMAENDPDKEFGELIEADDSSSSSSSSDGATDTSVSSGVSWKAIDKETARDFDDAVCKAISEGAVSASADADYLIYTKDKDVIEPLPVGREFKPTMLTSMQDKTEHMVAPLQKDLERAIAARSLSHWSPGHRSGRLHSSNLSRLAMGDSRVFRRKEESVSKDVAVMLVVDASGSMDGAKIATATQSAYALASVLERIGIKSEVICFTTGTGLDAYGKMQAEASKIGRQYSRVESLYMPILKGFDERMTTEVKNRFGWLPHSSILRNNVDGECVEIAARRLMARREKGKVMMVLSDGAPHAGGATRTLAPHLKKVVSDVTRTGVKVIGIGIMSDAVRQFYPKHIILNDVSELPVIVMKELRQLIVG